MFPNFLSVFCESVVYLFCTQVVFTEAIRAKGYHDQIPPHNFEFKHNAADPYERQIGTQVLMDILLLAKCDHFLHTESSVASLASYFNPHMISYFLQDEKPVKVCFYCLYSDEKHLLKLVLKQNNDNQLRTQIIFNEIILQEPRKLREGKRTEGTRKSELEGLDESEDFLETLECFQSNSAESACPNTAKGIFVSFQEAFDMFRPLLSDSYHKML